MKNKKAFFTTKWIAYTALLTALVIATGYIPGIPVLTGKIYWCDFVIYMSAYILDPAGAMIVGGIGTTFFDLFGINGTAYNALPSLIIHGLQGLTASLIFTLLKDFFNKSGSGKRELVIAIISSVIPALLVIFGYFIKRLTWEHVTADVALLKMPANVLQEIVGIAVAIIILYACGIKKQLEKAHLLPNFKKEVLTDKTTAEESGDVPLPSEDNGENL